MFYDLETTGTNPETCGIHQFSGTFLVDGVEKDSFDFHVKPRSGCECSQIAMEMAGHTYEEMMESDEYVPMDVAFRWIYNKIVEYGGGIVKDNHPDYNKRVFLAGYNIHKFDNEFLRRWFEDNHAPNPLGFYVAEAIDVMLLAVPALMKFRHLMPGFTQEEIAWALGINLESDKLHKSDYDIAICIAIYKALVSERCICGLPRDRWEAMHSEEDIKTFKNKMIRQRQEKKRKAEEIKKKSEQC